MKKVYVHILFWSAWLLYAWLEDYISFGMNFFYEFTYVLTQNIFLFYTFLHCLRKFSKENFATIFIGLGRFFLIAIIFFYIRFAVRYYILYDIFHDKMFREISLKELNIGSLTWLVSYFLLALGYFYFEKNKEKEKQLRILEQQKAQQLLLLEEADKQKLLFEQAFIRSQINPHFLYNVLSFLYSESLQYSNKLADAIYILSDIMRYSLQPETNTNTKFPLEKEINYIHNFIKLNQLRFNNQLQIKMKVSGDISNAIIAPMILMTFIENIFKHGDLKDTEHPVLLEITVANNQLNFFAKNKKNKVPSKEYSNGIGLDNVRKRLSYIYGNNFSLDIKNATDFYSSDLSVFNIEA